jgi:DNA helicase HerA-like ATPase
MDGRGVINVLAADKLMNSPRLYGCFLLWLLAELFEQLPEAGDLPKPKLVFFFDEAHLLFSDAPPALLEKIEQVVRLIRSKGVGVYFVTQNPLDIPDTRARPARQPRAARAARLHAARPEGGQGGGRHHARQPEGFDAATVITELGVGEALVSFLDEHGRPTIVERAMVLPPGVAHRPADAEERRAAIADSPIAGHYEKAVDRESAYEKLAGARDRARRARLDHGWPAPVGLCPGGVAAIP